MSLEDFKTQLEAEEKLRQAAEKARKAGRSGTDHERNLSGADHGDKKQNTSCFCSLKQWLSHLWNFLILDDDTGYIKSV